MADPWANVPIDSDDPWAAVPVDSQPEPVPADAGGYTPALIPLKRIPEDQRGEPVLSQEGEMVTPTHNLAVPAMVGEPIKAAIGAGEAARSGEVHRMMQAAPEGAMEAMGLGTPGRAALSVAKKLPRVGSVIVEDAGVAALRPPSKPLAVAPLTGEVIPPPSGQLIVPSKAAATAEDILYKDMIEAGWTPARIKAKLKQLGPDATMADLEPFWARQEVVAQYPAGAKNVVRELGRRDAGKKSRLLSSVDTTLSPKNYYKSIDELETLRAAESRQKYIASFSDQTPLVSELIDDMASNPDVLKGITNGLRIIRNENSGLPKELQTPVSTKGIKFNAAGDVEFVESPNLRILDAGVRGLDGMIEGYRNKLTGRLDLDDTGRSLVGLRKRLDDQLVAHTGGETGLYARAKADWAGPSRMKDVQRMGRQILDKDPEVSIDIINGKMIAGKKVGGLTTGEKEFLRIGLARALKDDIKANPTSALKHFADPDTREILRAAFKSKKEYNKFKRSALREESKARTFNQARGNSASVKRALGSAGLEDEVASSVPKEVVGTALDVATKNPWGLARRAVGWLLPSGKNKTAEPAAKEISSVLHSRDPAIQKMMVNRFQSRFSPRKVQKPQFVTDLEPIEPTP